MRHTIYRIFMQLIVAGLVASAFGQLRPKPQPGAVAPLIKAVRIQKPPTIDGIVDDKGEWKDVQSFDGLVDQTTGAPSPETALFWLAYDSDFIYFAARMEDSKPDQIRAVEYRSNVAISGDDTVSLTIDLSGSLADFSTFTVNPKGATTLAIAGGRAAKREWLGEFSAKGRVTATGWEAEAKIPWKVLPIPGKGKRNARFNVSRFISRLQQTYVYTFTGSGHTALTPIWGDVEMPREKNVRKLLMLPYVYTGYDNDNGVVANAGLDVKAPLTDTVNLVGTVSPDFRNLENQLLTPDFSRFERLIPEARPFFLEGNNYYATNIYTSQRIGNFDMGVNTYGKLDDKTSFGLLDAQALGRENDFVLNATRQIDSNTSLRMSAASMQTSTIDNKAFNLRFNKQIGPYGIFMRYTGSEEPGLGGGQNSAESLSYNFREWSVYQFHQAASANFNPRLGFIPEVDLNGDENGFVYTKVLTKGPLLGYSYGGDIVEYRHFDGGFYRRDWDLNGSINLRQGLKVTYLHDQPNFEGEKDHLDSLTVAYPSTNPYRNLSIGSDWGTQAVLPYHTVRIKGAYRTLGKLDLNLSYEGVNYQGFTDQVILSANYDMGRDRAITGRIVKQGTQINPYIAFRRSGNAGAEYFLILGNPNTDQFKTALVLKVTYPLAKVIGRG